MSFFDNLLRKYRDPKTPEFDKGVALGKMQELVYQRDMWNKANNPAKYFADMKKRALDRAAYYDGRK